MSGPKTVAAAGVVHRLAGAKIIANRIGGLGKERVFLFTQRWQQIVYWIGGLDLTGAFGPFGSAQQIIQKIATWANIVEQLHGIGRVA